MSKSLASGNGDGGSCGSIEVDCCALEFHDRTRAQGTFMCSAQNHARRTPRLQRFLPPRCAQTPAITGLQSRKAEFRDRHRQIVAAGLRILKKFRGHDGAHRVAADILAAGVAELSFCAVLEQAHPSLNANA
jgi:hypothetical protein